LSFLLNETTGAFDRRISCNKLNYISSLKDGLYLWHEVDCFSVSVTRKVHTINVGIVDVQLIITMINYDKKYVILYWLWHGPINHGLAIPRYQ